MQEKIFDWLKSSKQLKTSVIFPKVRSFFFKKKIVSHCLKTQVTSSKMRLSNGTTSLSCSILSFQFPVPLLVISPRASLYLTIKSPTVRTKPMTVPKAPRTKRRRELSDDRRILHIRSVSLNESSPPHRTLRERPSNDWLDKPVLPPNKSRYFKFKYFNLFNSYLIC